MIKMDPGYYPYRMLGYLFYYILLYTNIFYLISILNVIFYNLNMYLGIFR